MLDTVQGFIEFSWYDTRFPWSRMLEVVQGCTHLRSFALLNEGQGFVEFECCKRCKVLLNGGDGEKKGCEKAKKVWGFSCYLWNCAEKDWCDFERLNDKS